MYCKFEQTGFFCGGVYPHWYNFQLFLIIVEEVFRNEFFCIPLVSYSRPICNKCLRLFHSFADWYLIECFPYVSVCTLGTKIELRRETGCILMLIVKFFEMFI